MAEEPTEGTIVRDRNGDAWMTRGRPVWLSIDGNYRNWEMLNEDYGPIEIAVFLEELRGDIAAVLTVYDEHVAPENRGPWRDRLATLIGYGD